MRPSGWIQIEISLYYMDTVCGDGPYDEGSHSDQPQPPPVFELPFFQRLWPLGFTGYYPVPEPSTLALLGIDILGRIGYGRKGWRGSIHLPRQTKNYGR